MRPEPPDDCLWHLAEIVPRQSKEQKSVVQTPDGEVAVEIPDSDVEEKEQKSEPQEVVRKSFQIQALVARIGASMGFRIWIPRSDRGSVQSQIPAELQEQFLDKLPLNYDDSTLRTIEQIDVLWLKGRSMARAFEIEHTTAIYSGLLRMADLLALQPNMEIRLHIVAPHEKRDKVMREIKRPVFSLLEHGPLYKTCTFLSYEAVTALGATPHLPHVSDSIIEDFEEPAEEE